MGRIAGRTPSFTFHHSHGLGVLGVGTDLPPGLRALFKLDPEQAAQFRRRIAARGEAFQRQVDILGLREQSAAKDQQIASLIAQLASLAEQSKSKGASEAAMLAECDALRRDADAAAQLLGKAEARAVQAVAGREHAEQAAAWQHEILKAQRDQIAAKDAIIASLNHLAAARGAALTVRDRLIDSRDALAMQLASETGARLHDWVRLTKACCPICVANYLVCSTNETSWPAPARPLSRRRSRPSPDAT